MQKKIFYLEFKVYFNTIGLDIKTINFFIKILL